MSVISLHIRLVHIRPIFVRLKLFCNGTCLCKSIAS